MMKARIFAGMSLLVLALVGCDLGADNAVDETDVEFDGVEWEYAEVETGDENDVGAEACRTYPICARDGSVDESTIASVSCRCSDGCCINNMCWEGPDLAFCAPNAVKGTGTGNGIGTADDESASAAIPFCQRGRVCSSDADCGMDGECNLYANGYRCVCY